MIILLGFPKSGTSSFQKLFTDLGYKSFHWKKGGHFIGTLIKHNKATNRPLLSGFAASDCIAQMDVCVDADNAYWPQLTDYQQLYQENPTALFILNKRSPESLLSSFKRWGNLNARLQKYNPEILHDGSDEAFLALVRTHYANVAEFFAARPAKFIAYDIEKDPVQKLGKYLDLKGIKAFPKMNVGKV